MMRSIMDWRRCENRASLHTIRLQLRAPAKRSIFRVSAESVSDHLSHRDIEIAHAIITNGKAIGSSSGMISSMALSPYDGQKRLSI
jgi:hypothetical protein